MTGRKHKDKPQGLLMRRENNLIGIDLFDLKWVGHLGRIG